MLFPDEVEFNSRHPRTKRKTWYAQLVAQTRAAGGAAETQGLETNVVEDLFAQPDKCSLPRSIPV